MIMTSALNRNDDLIPLINRALDYVRDGDIRASALRAKINIKLQRRGYDPKQFWTDFIEAAEIVNKPKQS